MSGDSLAGFWCYTHDDNEQDGGGIVALASALSAEFRMTTGQDLTIFVDRSSIQWGDEWRARIADALDTTTFLFLIITPRFFQSEECRKELLRFSGQAGSLGIGELIMPLLYVTVADLVEDSADEAKALVARMQRVDIRDLRFIQTGSPEYRRRVNTLAQKLDEVAQRLADSPELTPEEIAATTGPASDPENGDDDDAGYIDLIAKFEEDLPRWQATIEEFPQVMQEFSALASEATEKMQKADESGKPFAYRIVVARDLAAKLAAPARRIVELGEAYATQLVDVDPGVRALIRASIESEKGPEELTAVCGLFDSIRQLVGISRESMDSLEGLIKALDNNAKMSRDLRPVLREMRSGLRGITDGQTVIDEWEALIDASGIDCPPEQTDVEGPE